MTTRRRSPRRRSASTGPVRRASPPADEARPRAPTYDDLLQIVRLIESGSRFTEFRLRAGDIEVDIRRANGAPRLLADAESAMEPAAAPMHAPPPHDAEKAPPGVVLLRAPMVGIFYRSPAPNAPPFVEPGTRVAADSIVCIIEVMKLMNSITAGVAGVVTNVLVNNAEPVEYGQPLIAIDPGA